MFTTEIVQMLLHHFLQKRTHNPFKEFGMKFYYISLTVEYTSQLVALNY
jgi:hypothetical protein